MRFRPFPIIVALGCNAGSCRETLLAACDRLERRGVRIVGRSRLYRTRPWGVSDQPDFFNTAVAVQTDLTPYRLLRLLLDVERDLGRKRDRRWGPRAIDLDLILYGNVRCDLPELTLPHPCLEQRDFVLAPLIDLGVPGDWQALLRSLPEEDRTIIEAKPWR